MKKAQVVNSRTKYTHISTARKQTDPTIKWCMIGVRSVGRASREPGQGALSSDESSVHKSMQATCPLVYNHIIVV